jgi:serine/threonine-protein kinase RsbW
LAGSADVLADVLIDVLGRGLARRDGGAPGMRLSATLSLPRQPSSVAHARHILDTLLGLIDISHDEHGPLALLLTEAIANAVQHAAPSSQVDVAITIQDDECVIEVGNHGQHPGPAALAAGLPAPLTTAGGRGLPLIAALADTATFVPTPPGQVLLRMRKRLVLNSDGGHGHG